MKNDFAEGMQDVGTYPHNVHPTRVCCSRSSTNALDGAEFVMGVGATPQADVPLPIAVAMLLRRTRCLGWSSVLDLRRVDLACACQVGLSHEWLGLQDSRWSGGVCCLSTEFFDRCDPKEGFAMGDGLCDFFSG